MKQIDINTITFGNPTQAQIKEFLNYEQKEDFYDTTADFFEKIKVENYPFPLNDSLATIQELNEIVENIEIISAPYNDEKRNYMQSLNENLEATIIDYFKIQKDYDFTEIVNDISSEMNSIIYLLKFNYNRPRPFQLANILKLKLFPFQKNIDTPSYPSAGVLKAKLMFTAITRKHSELKEDCQNLLNLISDAKIYLGTNYRSDNEFSLEIADKIIDSNNFSKKYLEDKK